MTKLLKRLGLCVLVLCMTVFCGVFAAACGDSDEKDTPDNTTTTTPEDNNTTTTPDNEEEEEEEEEEETPTAPVLESYTSISVKGTEDKDGNLFDHLEVTFKAGEAQGFLFGAMTYVAGQQFMLELSLPEGETYSRTKDFTYFCGEELLAPPKFGPKVMFSIPEEFDGPPLLKLAVVAPTDLEEDITLWVTITAQDYNG